MAAQFFLGGSMSALFDSQIEGAAVDGATLRLAYLHAITGAAVFAAVAVRLWDRQTHGRPPRPDQGPAWARSLARVTQFLLYALLLAMPIAGIAAFRSGSETIASLHAAAATALLILVALHVCGALAEQFWFKSAALRRMLPGAGRQPDTAAR